MKLIKPAFIIIFSFALLSCNKEDGWDCLKSLGEEISEVRETGAYAKIDIRDRIDLEYRYSESYFIEVEFGENIISEIKTEVVGDVLKIQNTAKCNWVRDLSKKPLVICHAPEIRGLLNYSSGDIVFRDSLKTTSFVYEQWDANGKVDLLVNTDSSGYFLHTGSVEINLRGRSSTTNVYSASTSKINALQLISGTTLVNNTSIMDIYVHASDYLYAAIYLRGDIIYGGNPGIVESDIQGSGVLKPL